MTKKLYLFFLFCFVLTPLAIAQSCTYLAYDGFDYAPNTSLYGLSGGGGWASPWDVQASSVTQPGYQTAATSLSYANLQSVGNRLTGGDVYLGIGRLLDDEDGGAFDAYVAQWQNGIGSEIGTSLWASVVLRKDENNDEQVFSIWHNHNSTWYYQGTSQRVGLGYFGAASNVAGQRYWSLMVGNTIYPTSVPVVSGDAALLVVRFDFLAGGTNISAYINPASLGNTLPASPTITQTAPFALQIRALAAIIGDNPNSGAIDELRMGSSYACVTPDPAVSVNFPPIANFSLSATTGQAPFSTTLNGTSSIDPEAGALTYSWNFGDGTTGVGATVSHIYEALGELTVCLTVTDNTGQSNQTCQNITVLNAANTFPCLSSFTVMNPVSCGQANGHLRINDMPTTFALRNMSNVLMPISNGNEYNNLAAGAYLYTAAGTNGCRDTFPLIMQTDSSTCVGWSPIICQMSVGTNMSSLADWGVERPMKNLMKHGRIELIGYIDGCFCWNSGMGNELVLDADGYPTHIPQTTSLGQSLARIIISSESANGTNLQAGNTYVLLYDGVGTMNIGGGAVINSTTSGRIEFSINNNVSNYYINLTSSEINNHVRNMRLLRLADEFANLSTAPFYQGFLDKIAPFHTLRFMDWGMTNGNPSTQWSERSSVSHRTYSQETGVPYEIMVQLANQSNKNVWICVPHLADDNYITQMATYFRDNLNPNLTVYLEYSNEVWNWIFSQAHYNADHAPSNLNYGRAYSEKAKKTFRIWHQVYGTQNSRVKRVLGLQVTYNWLNEQILAQLHPDEWDYGAPTHYFGLNHGTTGNPVLNAGTTPQNIISNSRNYWYENIPLFRQDYEAIKLFGKEIITYEGGQHFVGNSFGIPYPYQQAMWDAQIIPEMYTLYDEVLDSIRTWGCKMAVNFSLGFYRESVYGSWGAVDDIDIQPPYMTTAPKYQALLDNICPSAPLSVEMPNFSVYPYQNEAALLVWAAINDPQNKGFEVQRSTNGQDFEKIGWVNAKETGNSNAYQFKDYGIKTNVLYYYRLKQIDLDGKFHYSERQTLSIYDNHSEVSILLIPNPNDGKFQLVTNFHTSVKVYDMQGVLIWEDKTQLSMRELDFTYLPQGVYLIKTEMGTQKWLKQ